MLIIVDFVIAAILFLALSALFSFMGSVIRHERYKRKRGD